MRYACTLRRNRTSRTRDGANHGPPELAAYISLVLTYLFGPVPGFSSLAKAAPRPTLPGVEPRTCLTLASVPCVSKDDAEALRPP